MSLINDALKRAKKSQQQQPPATPPALMPPVPAPSDSPGGANWLFAVLLVALIIAAGLFIGLAMGPRKQVTPPAPAADPAQYTKAVAPPPVLPKALAPASAPAPTQRVAAVAASPVPPALKVQGIFYNSDRPQAIVNGHTVYIGDNVSGFRVRLISKDEVSFIAPDGSEKSLALGE